MAEIGGQVSGLLDGLFSGTVATLFWVFLFLIVFGIVGGIVWYFAFYKKKFDIVVKITSRRALGAKEFFDKGAILYDDKTKTRYLRLLKTKVDIDLPKFKVLRTTNWGDYIELHRESELGFSFLTPPRIDKEYYISVDGKKYPFKNLVQRNIESDISFILKRQKDNKRIIDPESILFKILAHLPLITSGAIMLMILWVTFRYAPDWVNAMQQLVREINSKDAPVIVGSWIGLMFRK